MRFIVLSTVTFNNVVAYEITNKITRKKGDLRLAEDLHPCDYWFESKLIVPSCSYIGT